MPDYVDQAAIAIIRPGGNGGIFNQADHVIPKNWKTCEHEYIQEGDSHMPARKNETVG